MNSEEIKQTVTMYEVLGRYGIRPGRSNMICCPFHGEKHPSMKIYKDGYNCFACGLNGDIFGFVMEMERCDFKTAFQILGGSYSSADPTERKRASIMVERRKRQAESRKIRERRKELSKKQLNGDITKYRALLDSVEPMTDIWCDYMAKLCDLLQRKEWEDTYDI